MNSVFSSRRLCEKIFLLSHPISHRPVDESVILVTQDSGPRMTASQLGIRVLELPAECKLSSEPNPIELENRELAKTIVVLQNALPKLIVSFTGSDESEHHATFCLPRPQESMDYR